MGALDELLADAPPRIRRQPPDGAMEKILAARKLGWSYRKIAEAFAKDHSPVHHETISRWVREAQ